MCFFNLKWLSRYFEPLGRNFALHSLPIQDVCGKYPRDFCEIEGARYGTKIREQLTFKITIQSQFFHTIKMSTFYTLLFLICVSSLFQRLDAAHFTGEPLYAARCTFRNARNDLVTKI